MKSLITFILIVITLSSCSSNRYLLSDNNDDKEFLSQKIKEFKNKEGITSKPLIVIDGKPYRYTHELKEKKLELSKSEIKEINLLKKDVGIRIYGDFAEGGVLVITTKESYEQEEKKRNKTEGKDFAESNVLFLVDDKEISKENLESINPNDIETITVIKDKEVIKKYTNKVYDGVVIIVMKKQ